LADAVEADPADANLAGKLADAPVVVAVGRKALAAAKAKAGPRAAVVFCMVLGVTSADLGPAVTGVPLESDPKEVFARLHAVVPGARKVGVVYDPRGSGLLIERARAAASASGLTLVAKPVGAPGEVK